MNINLNINNFNILQKYGLYFQIWKIILEHQKQKKQRIEKQFK